MFKFPVEVAAFIMFFVTQGIKSVAEKFGIEVAGWGSVLIAAAVGAFVVFAQTVVGAASPEVQQVVVAVLVILAGFGTHRTVKTIQQRD